MSTTIRMTVLVISLFYAFTGTAQQTPLKIVVFDTVKAFEIAWDDVTITGIEKDTGASVNIRYRDDKSRCIATILTALEKPGRYLLTVASQTEPSPDPPPWPPYLRYCRLELKT